MFQRNSGSQSSIGAADQSYSNGSFAPAQHLAPNVRENAAVTAARLLSPNGMTGQGASTEVSVSGDQYLVFTLLERDFAIKAEHIQGVERMADVTPIPNVASWISGVINLRGSIASVVDLRAFLDMEQLPHNPRTRLLSVKYNEMLICLVVDSVSEMVPLPEKAIQYGSRSIPVWVAPYAAGFALAGKREIIILDAARLLFSDKMHHYSV